MLKRILSCAAMAALTMTAPNPAAAQTQVWDLYFYSDATHTQMVGYAQSRCTRDFQGSILIWGYSTQYRVEDGHRPCGPGYYDDQ